MAQTNYTPIQLYYSTTAAAVPVNTNLLNGELAINITDGKLYYKDNSGTVQVIATKGAGTIGGSTTQIQYNNAGALAGSSAMVFDNSTNVVTLTTLNLTNALGAIYGGTGLSTYTTGDLLYSSASNTLAKLAIGTANYILTVNSGGTNVQWSAPSSISVSTATNLAGGAAGSVPYQSAAATTTFLAIGAADRVMTSSGSAPQWVTALTSLTGVSSSSITNTSLTSGRVVYSGTGGLETDSANLTFNGTTLTTTGLSNSGTSALVRLVTVGDTSFNGATVFAAATPAKLYMGTGTATDTTSAIGATNAVGAVASLAITPIAATNTSVTYTNASTLYIAGAPSAGTNITITNPYALYVAAGASYLGGNTAVTGTLSATSTVSAGNGENVFGTGGTGATSSSITLNGGSTSGWGSFITFKRNSVSKGFVGLESQLIGNNSDDTIVYAISGQNVKQVVNAATITTTSSTGLAVTGKITVTGDTTNYGVLSTNPSGYGAFSLKSATVNQTWSFIANDNGANSDLLIYGGSSAGTKLTLDSSGNLGIGSTSPIAKLDISGISTTQNGLRLTTSGGGLALAAFTTDTSTGEIRIGGTVGAAGNYFPVFYSAGAEKMRISTDANPVVTVGDLGSVGRLGTGYATIGAWGSVGGGLRIYRGTGAGLSTALIYADGTGFFINEQEALPITFTINGSERARIDSIGNMGLGVAPSNTSSSYRAIQIKSLNATTILTSDYSSQYTTNAYWDGSAWQRGGNDYAPVYYNQFDGTHTFARAAAAGSSITWTNLAILDVNSLYVYVGVNPSSNGVASARIFNSSAGASTTTLYIGNASITTVSDSRLKENVVDSQRNALELLGQLRVVDHTWNDPSDQCENNRNSRGTWMGLIAQEAQPVIPWLVNKPTADVDENGDPQYWHMDYGYSVPLLVKAIQEQQALITQLTARITALEGA
jgi:hypothetical protein